MVLLSTSPGGRGGKSVLELALSQIPRFGGEIRGSVSVPSFHENFDSDRSVITNPEIETEIRAALALLLADG
jgi:chromate reductase